MEQQGVATGFAVIMKIFTDAAMGASSPEIRNPKPNNVQLASPVNAVKVDESRGAGTKRSYSSMGERNCSTFCGMIKRAGDCVLDEQILLMIGLPWQRVQFCPARRRPGNSIR